MSDPITEIPAETLLADTRWLARLAHRLVRDEDAASELVQETWRVFLERRPDTRRPLRPWLRGVLKNLARRPRRRDTETIEVEPTASRRANPAVRVEEFELQKRVIARVDELTEPQRSIVLLRYFRDLNATEIGRALDMPPGTVRWQLGRAIEQLRSGLDEDHDGDRKAWVGVLGPWLAWHDERGSFSHGSPRQWLAAIAGLTAIAVTLALIFETPDGEGQPDTLPAAALDDADRNGTKSVDALPAQRTAVGEASTSEADALAPIPWPADPPGGAMSGRVLDQEGQGIAGATVFARRSNGFLGPIPIPDEGPSGCFEILATTRTGPEGRFRFEELPPGHVRLTAFADGHERSWNAVAHQIVAGSEVPETEGMIWMPPLAEGERIALQVDPGSGPPEPIHLLYRGPHTNTTWQCFPDRTPFLFPSTRRLDELLIWTTTHWARRTKVDAQSGRLKVSLEPRPSLEVRRMDGGREDWRIDCVSPEGEIRFARIEVPGASRSALVPLLPGVPCRLEVRAPGRRPLYLDGIRGPAPDGEDAVQEVRLLPMPEPSGLVRAGGEPAAGFVVSLYRALPPSERYVYNSNFGTTIDPRRVATTKTNELGRFQLDVPTDGQYVCFFGPSGKPPQISAPLSLVRGGSFDGVVLDFPPPGHIRGSVLGTAGEALANQVVTIGRAMADDRVTRTDASGNYAFADVPPGAWQVRLLEDEPDETPHYFRRFALETNSWGWHENCTVEPGEVARFDFDQRPPEEAILTGTVEIVGDDPKLWEAYVMYTPYKDLQQGFREFTSPLGADGSFTIRIPEPGRPVVGARRRVGPFLMYGRPWDVTPTSEPLHLRCEFGSIEGFAWTVPDNHRLGMQWVYPDGWMVRAWLVPSPEGEFALPAAPIGKAVVGFASQDEQLVMPSKWALPLREFEVLPGTTTYLELD